MSPVPKKTVLLGGQVEGEIILALPVVETQLVLLSAPKKSPRHQLMPGGGDLTEVRGAAGKLALVAQPLPVC